MHSYCTQRLGNMPCQPVNALACNVVLLMSIMKIMTFLHQSQKALLIADSMGRTVLLVLHRAKNLSKFSEM